MFQNLNKLINIRLNDLRYSVRVDSDSGEVLHDTALSNIAQIVRQADKSAPYGDERVLAMMNIGDLMLILDHYLTERTSTEVILRGYREGKILIRSLVSLLLNLDECDDEAAYENGFLQSTPEEVFLGLMSDAGYYAIEIYRMIYENLIMRYRLVGDRKMYSILHELHESLYADFEEGRQEILFCMLLFVVPLAYYMRCHERTSLHDVAEKAKLYKEVIDKF